MICALIVAFWGLVQAKTIWDQLRSVFLNMMSPWDIPDATHRHASFTQACINLCKSYEISNRSLLGQICKSLEFLCKSASLCITMHDFLISGSSIGQSRDSWCRAKVSAARNCPSSGPSLVKVRGRLEKRFHNISWSLWLFHNISHFSDVQQLCKIVSNFMSNSLLLGLLSFSVLAPNLSTGSWESKKVWKWAEYDGQIHKRYPDL